MNTCVISCTLPLPTNYRITDILSFHVRDAQAVAEIVYADRLHKGIVWQGSLACFALRLLSQCAMGLEPHFPANHDDFPPVATKQVNLNRHRFYCATGKTITTVSIKICTAIGYFHCKW